MKLRVKFKKTGAVRYIGHLDTMRFFQKVMRRADIDIKYTTGFSPHQVMSFAQPLSVGIESMGEYMDIDVGFYEGEEAFLNKVNASSVPGMECLSVNILPDNAENAMASVKSAEYNVKIKPDKCPDGLKELLDSDSSVISTKINAFLESPAILIKKEGKNGLREVDIRPGIYRFEFANGVFNMLLDASSGGNIKPLQVMQAFLTLPSGEELNPDALHITRLDMFTDNFVSLGNVGYKTIREYEGAGEGR